MTCSICQRSRPASSCSNCQITASRISLRLSAARLSRWRPTKSSHSKSRWLPNYRRATATGGVFAQVLINLVGNAIKFTDAGEVAIKAEANNGSFHVSIRDTGPGISAADQANLFQEFQQADNAITRKKGGTGLGLAISKRIIEMHGGRIWVESQPGQGSTFAFTLPVIVERQVEPA